VEEWFLRQTSQYTSLQTGEFTLITLPFSVFV